MEYNKLGHIAKIQTGPFGSQLHQSDYKPAGIPCIMPCNIGSNLNIICDNIAYISEDDLNRLAKHITNEGDIVYSRRGDIEKCAYISSREAGWLCGTGCLKVSIDSTIAIPKYVAYLLSTPDSKAWLVGNAVGTTMLNLNTTVLSDFPISLPDLDTQQKVVDIIDAIADKIELNKRINDNLEQQAQALYKSWFVDFEPFQDGEFVESELGIIPRGWQCIQFNTFVSESKVKTGEIGIKEFSVTNNGIFPREAKYNKSLSQSSAKNKLIKCGDLVFGMSRDILNWGVMQEERGGVSSAYTVYNINSEIVNSTYLELFIKSRVYLFSDLIRPAAREGQGIDKSLLQTKLLLQPPQEVLNAFWPLYNSVTNKTQTTTTEINRLGYIRDTLLPKLMSGELKINEIDC